MDPWKKKKKKKISLIDREVAELLGMYYVPKSYTDCDFQSTQPLSETDILSLFYNRKKLRPRAIKKLYPASQN